ncbi:hypothetical protein DOA20_23285 [Salmonella enterica subsp. enterica serovar Newport]|nr:hypothetical protein [Salmonella enterica subsp. enterica serovar Newport]
MDAHHETPTQTQQVRRLLQAATDHYPRLLVVEFSLRFPRPGVPPEAVLPELLSAIWRRTGDYSGYRQAAGKPAPPTLMRAMWGQGAGELRVLLMLNRDTFYHPRRDKVFPEGDIITLLHRACDDVIP